MELDSSHIHTFSIGIVHNVVGVYHALIMYHVASFYQYLDVDEDADD